MSSPSIEVADHVGTMTLRRLEAAGTDQYVTLGLPAAAKIRVLHGRVPDRSLFHRVPDRARLATIRAS